MCIKEWNSAIQNLEVAFDYKKSIQLEAIICYVAELLTDYFNLTNNFANGARISGL